MHAAMDGDGSSVSNQLGQGSDVNIRDNEGLTALMLAARFSHVHSGTSQFTIAMSLLEHGAEIELRDSMGKTALMHSASSNVSSLVALLLKHGADINAQDCDGRTALMSSASARGNFPDTALVLLEHGADVNLKDRKGHTALMSAAAFGQASLAGELVRLCAQVNHQGSDGMTALMFAAREGNANVIEALLELGADPDLRDRYDRSALDYATARGHLEAVALLDVSTEADTRGEDTPIRAEPNRDTGATEVGADAGRAAVYVFDYEQMGSAYGTEVFDAIALCLDGSTGMCTFLHGDLEVAAGGPSRVPGLLMEIRDNGWNITSHSADSPPGAAGD